MKKSVCRVFSHLSFPFNPEEALFHPAPSFLSFAHVVDVYRVPAVICSVLEATGTCSLCPQEVHRLLRGEST